MLAKIAGVALLVVGALLALKIAGVLIGLIWEIALALFVLGVLFAGWRLLKS